MPGITPDEGETLAGNLVYKRVLTDRDANLQLGLFTNPVISETTTHAQVTEPSGGGYARKTLVDGTWANPAPGQFTYAQQVFTSTGGMTGNIHGYFIATIASGGTQRLLHIERFMERSVTGITRSGSTATANIPAHGYVTGQTINFQGANQTEYNGVFTVTVVDANNVTYTVTGTPATPATGTITANRVITMPNNGDNHAVDLSNVVA